MDKDIKCKGSRHSYVTLKITIKWQRIHDYLCKKTQVCIVGIWQGMKQVVKQQTDNWRTIFVLLRILYLLVEVAKNAQNKYQ